MNFNGCISCKKCEFIRGSAFCGTNKLTEKQLYNDKGHCSDFEDKTQPKKNIVVLERGEKMTIDEAIERHESMAEGLAMKAGFETDNPTYTMSEAERREYKESAEESLQIAGWLKELKQLREQTRWIPVGKKSPKTDDKNEINKYNVLLWVKNKTHPEREPQIYLGKLKHIDGDDGSNNFWGIKTEPCDWAIWGWSYFNEPEVVAWMPLPKSYNAGEKEEK